jgi:hypothetical protein
MRAAVLIACGCLAGCSYDFESFTPAEDLDSALVEDSSSADSFVSPDTATGADTSATDSVGIDTTTAADTAIADTGVVVVDTAVTDTATTVSCTDAEGKLFGGHCYFPLASQDGNAAKTACEGKGAHLVTITSAGEETFVEGIRIGRDRWIGLRRPPSAPSVEASFAWVTGEPVTYKKWGGGEPSGSGECVSLRSANNWTDQDCKNSRDVICERE